MGCSGFHFWLLRLISARPANPDIDLLNLTVEIVKSKAINTINTVFASTEVNKTKVYCSRHVYALQSAIFKQNIMRPANAPENHQVQTA